MFKKLSKRNIEIEEGFQEKYNCNQKLSLSSIFD